MLTVNVYKKNRGIKVFKFNLKFKGFFLTPELLDILLKCYKNILHK